MNGVRLTEVNNSIGGIAVVPSMNLPTKVNQSAAIAGPSGCSKPAGLRKIAGFESAQDAPPLASGEFLFKTNGIHFFDKESGTAIA